MHFLLVFLYFWFPPSSLKLKRKNNTETKTTRVNLVEDVAHVSLFFVKFCLRSAWVFIYPPTAQCSFMSIWMTEMTEFPPDGVADCGTRVQGTLQVCQLPFDSDRARTFVTVPLLISVFHICRYQWSERGVFVYLTFQEQTQVALVNWSAWNETSERRSDDLFNMSPAARNHAGMVHYQIA